MGRISAAELAAGWRLSCMHRVVEDCQIVLPRATPAVPVTKHGDRIAIDIGTTRIKWSVTSDDGGYSEYAIINPQMGVGSEVMSRLRYALSSDAARTHLRESIVSILRMLVRDSAARAVAIAGNSVMIALLLDIPLDGLAYAPYALPWAGGSTVTISKAIPEVYVPPLLGPFIGADISAGLAYLWTQKPQYPFLLADLGTNGEFVLAVDEEHFHACSVPMGPSIEGVGLCCGALAGSGVASRFSLGPKGLEWATNAPLQGISGTGYISLLATLRRLGLLDIAGHFVEPAMPLARKIAAQFQNTRMGRILSLDGDIYLAERDVEEFLKAKAAVNVAIRTLLNRAGVGQQDLARIYTAGAIGEHLVPADVITLGFFPECALERIDMVGNTSLAGTMMALERDDVRYWLSSLTERVTVEALVDDAGFQGQYFQAMQFVWA